MNYIRWSSRAGGEIEMLLAANNEPSGSGSELSIPEELQRPSTPALEPGNCGQRQRVRNVLEHWMSAARPWRAA